MGIWRFINVVKIFVASAIHMAAVAEISCYKA